MNTSSPPQLSVILVTPDSYETIRRTIVALRKQTVSKQLEIVIVAKSKNALDLDEELTEFHSVRVVEFGQVQTLAAPRVAGIQAASAPQVALGEDHAFPEPGWAEALLQASRDGYAAVGCAFGNGNPGLLSWTSLVMDYGRWIEPVARGVTDDVPGHNTAWHRSLLLEYGADLERMLRAPTIMHWELQAKGYHLYLEPSAKVHHVNISLLPAFVCDHFYGAQVFSSARARHWPWFKRLFYVAGMPVLMVRTFRRWLGHIRRTGLQDELLPRGWPLLFLSIIVWGLGETAGYAIGSGKSEEGTLNYDARRGAYLSRKDRSILGEAEERRRDRERETA